MFCMLAMSLSTSAAANQETTDKAANAFTYQAGEITLPGEMAALKLNKNYKFLDSKQAKTVIEEIWGNPESDAPLGMIVPANFDPTSAGGWAIIVTFSEDGYVNDEDAEKIDYTKLLTEMKEEIAKENIERKKENYPTIELVGWATPPKYVKAEHKMYWAKELKFEGDETSTLNYNIRVLGRKGVLVLNAVADMQSLKEIEKATPEILSMVEFTKGNTYADFNKDSDKVAGYGIAALVAGGLAAKVGLFKGLWIAILAFKKFILFGIFAVGSAVASLWKRKKNKPE